MTRLSVTLAALMFLLAPAMVLGQGVLVVVDPDQHVRLPRPIIIYPPHPPHPPHPPRPPRRSRLDMAGAAVLSSASPTRCEGVD